MSERTTLHAHQTVRAALTAAAVVAVASLGGLQSAYAHKTLAAAGAATFKCTSSGFITPEQRQTLTAPFSQTNKFSALQRLPAWNNVMAHFIVNLDKAKPCFGYSDQENWTRAVSMIPAGVVGLQISPEGKDAFIYVSGIPDYEMEMPKVFSSFKPGETYGIFRFSSRPIPDDRPVHDLVSRGSIGILVNGVSIFNYTDTFSYANTGLWSYDANVAEALIVNSDVSHATPSNMPQFPKSRGVFHNHQVSAILMHQLRDPFVFGKLEPSKLLGFAIDSNPIYGPIGYTSKDLSSNLKVLRSSYVQRSWLSGGTGHRSSMPEWAVANWDSSSVSSTRLLNLFQKKKAEVLYSDGRSVGPIEYRDTDEKLAAEIKALQQSVGLKRDAAGYVYWESPVKLPNGGTATTKNYLLKSSDLWGPAFDARILPASYQAADVDKFYFVAKLGSFAEDYEFVQGYGDLDFYNGIDSYLPERGSNVYHYVTPFSADVADPDRMNTASFPYFIGIQYKSKPDPFNSDIDNNAERISYFSRSGSKLQTVFDLGTTGRTEQGKSVQGSVISLWREKLKEQ